MQKRRLIPLLLPDRHRIASVCLVALFSVIFSVTASAQTDANDLPYKSEYNKDVRTGTWSIYAQGGLAGYNEGSICTCNKDESSSGKAIGGGKAQSLNTFSGCGSH